MKINVPFDTLKSVKHVSDIHIRLFKRHDEYREVFATFYDQLKASDTENSIIVVAGDVVHAKTDMSPEMLQVASEFLSSLADIAPTFVIAGNHDLNLSNMSRLDSLTPIIKSLNHKNLHYLKHSGIYQVADTDIAVFSILDDRQEWPSVANCRKDAKKIGLYHGPIYGAKTDLNYTITSKHVEISMFDGLDAVLLGDIHKYQVLQERTKTKPVIVYSSSLIQQNHGESVKGHGWCRWNLDTFDHTFVQTPNTFGYYTLELKDNAIAYPSDMPKNLRLRLFTGNADSTTIKKLTATLRKRYNILELSLNKSKTQLPQPQKTATASATDLTNVDTQNTLIRDWIERTHESIDEDTLAKVANLNTKINGQINHDDHSRNINWKPIKFTFSNMFSYGESNEINFDGMKGIYGIFAANASGKSSSIDALMFCLYDKTPRAFRGDHIVNNRRDSFECELHFEINEEAYFIRRTGTRKKTGEVKVDVSFWKENEDGTHLSLNAEDRRATNAIIRNYVGSYEDFVMTTLSSQNANALFIDKSHSERKDLLIQFMGLNIFDALYDAANEEVKEISAALKKFRKIDFTQTLVDTQVKLEETKLHHAEVERLLVESKTERDDTYAKLKSWQNQKRPLPNIEIDLGKLESKLKSGRSAIREYQVKKDNLLEIVSDIDARIANNEQLKAQNDMTAISADSQLYDKLDAEWKQQTSALKMVLSKTTEKLNFKNKLQSYKFNVDCDVCVDNNQTIIADLTAVRDDLAELHKTQVGHEIRILEIEREKKALQPNKDKYDAAVLLIKVTEDLYRRKQQLQSEISVVDATVDKLKVQTEHIEHQIQVYHTNEENIKFNQDVELHISHLEYDISVNKKVLDKLETELRNLYAEIKVLESSKADIMTQIKDAEELETTYEAYKYYLEAVGRDGVPHEMMSRTIPAVEAEINNILTQIVDFTISLEVDGKNIIGKLNYDHERIWALENSSGMERFISSIAIRVALLNASNLPKTNFLIIDEGLGVLDAENLGSMHTLFGLLKTQFDFMIVISHLEAARDMVDKVINIKREDGFSYINV